MQIRKKWLNQLKNFFNKHFKEYYLASFCWWIPSSCENHCNLLFKFFQLGARGLTAEFFQIVILSLQALLITAKFTSHLPHALKFMLLSSAEIIYWFCFFNLQRRWWQLARSTRCTPRPATASPTSRTWWLAGTTPSGTPISPSKLLLWPNNTRSRVLLLKGQCQRHRWCTLTYEYLREFSKKFEMTLMLFSGAWGKVIHEKNLKQKSRDTIPLT
jgi:hypothetical protein